MNAVEIAEQLFKNNLTNIKLITDDTLTSLQLFEILITICLEGFDMISDDMTKFDYTQFEISYLTALNKWLNNIDFNINIDSFITSDKQLYNNFYCRIVINTPQNAHLFTERKIQHEKYHLFINPNTYHEYNKHEKQLEEFYAVFTCNNMTYKIYFN